VYRNAVVGVVVPAYNEEGFVGEVIDTVPDFVDRVYAIDDCSTDGTWGEIRRHAAETNRSWPPTDGAVFDRRVIAIRHDENGGVGAAVKTGYRRALADEVDAVAVMNGDGQMPPQMLDRLLDPVVEGAADYAKGNRLVFPDYREGMSAWRLFGNAVLSGLNKVASGYWRLSDPQNGYTVISRRALERVPVDDLYDEYGFCNHLLVNLNAAGMTVADVALPAVYGAEQSDIRYSTFVPMLSWLLLRSFLWRLKTQYVVFDFHPLVAFYAFGVVGATTSVAVLAGAAGATGAGVGAPLSRVVLAVVGLLVLLCGGLSTAGAVLLDTRQNAGLVRQQYDRAERSSVPSPGGTARPAGRDAVPAPSHVSDEAGVLSNHAIQLLTGFARY